MNFKMFNNFKTLLLAGAMLVGVVSCTDYDDDITSLNDRIDALTESTVTIDDLATQLAAIEATIPDVTDLTSDVNSLLEEIQQIDVLDASISSLTSSVASDLAALETTLKSYTDGEITTLEASVEATYATIAALNAVDARLELVETYVSGLPTELTTITDAISALTTKLSALDNTIASWTGTDLIDYISGQGYVTNDQVVALGYVTTSDVEALISGLLDEAAVKAIVESYGYTTLDAVALVGYLESSDLETALADYLKTVDLDSYISEFVTSTEMTSALEGLLDAEALAAYLSANNYATTSDLTDALVEYAKQTDLDSYATTEALEASLTVYATKEALDDYVTTSGLATELESYYTKSEITDVLTKYFTKDEVTSMLGDYFTKDEITSMFGDYYTKSDIDTTLDSYVLESYLTANYYDSAAIDAKVLEINNELAAIDAAQKAFVADMTSVLGLNYTVVVDADGNETYTVSSTVLNEMNSLISGLRTDVDTNTSDIATLRGEVDTLKSQVSTLEDKVTVLENMVQSLVYVPSSVSAMYEVEMDGSIYYIEWSNGASTFLPANSNNKASVELKFCVTPASIATDLAALSAEDFAAALKIVDEQITRSVAESEVFSIVDYTLVDGGVNGYFKVKIEIDETDANVLTYLADKNNTYAIALSITAAGSDYLTNYIAVNVVEEPIAVSDISYNLISDPTAALAESYEIKYTSSDTLSFFNPEEYAFYYKGALLSEVVACDGLTLGYSVDGSKSSAYNSIDSYLFGDYDLSMSIGDSKNINLIGDVVTSDVISFMLSDGTNSEEVGAGSVSIEILTDNSTFTLEDISEVKWTYTYATQQYVYERTVAVTGGEDSFGSVDMTLDMFNALFSTNYSYVSATYTLTDESGAVVSADGISIKKEDEMTTDVDPKSVTVLFDATKLPATGVYSLVVKYEMADKQEIDLVIEKINIIGEPVVGALSATYSSTSNLSDPTLVVSGDTFTFGSVSYATYIADLVASYDDANGQFAAGELETYISASITSAEFVSQDDLVVSTILDSLPAFGESAVYSAKYEFTNAAGEVLATVSASYEVTNDLTGTLTPSTLFIAVDADGTLYSKSSFTQPSDLTTEFSMKDLFAITSNVDASIEYKIDDTDTDYLYNLNLLQKYTYVSKVEPVVGVNSTATYYVLTWNDWATSELPLVATLVWNGIEIVSANFEVRSDVIGELVDPVVGAAWSGIDYEIKASVTSTHVVDYSKVGLANTLAFVTDGAVVDQGFSSSFAIGTTVTAVYTGTEDAVSDTDLQWFSIDEANYTITYQNNPEAVAVLRGITFTCSTTYGYNLYGGLEGFDNTLTETITVTFEE